MYQVGWCEVRFQYSADCRHTTTTTTTVLGTYHSDSVFHVHAIIYNIIYQYINNLLHTYFLYFRMVIRYAQARARAHTHTHTHTHQHFLVK